MSIGNISHFLALLVAVIPFLFLPWVYNPYELPKFFAFVVGILVMSSWLVQDRILEKSLHPKGHLRLPRMTSFKNPLIFAAFVYIAIVFVANIQGIDPKTSFIGSIFRHQGFITLLAGFILLFVMQSLGRDYKEKIFGFFQKTIFLSTGFICLISLLQAFQFFILHDSSVTTYQGRIIATFGNPNFLGGYLAVVLPLIVFELYRELYLLDSLASGDLTRRIKRVLFLILIFMILFVIYLTGSRAAFLAVAVVLFLYACTFLQRLSGWKKLLPIVVVGICMVMAFQFYQNNILFFSRASFWDNRTLIWQEGIKAVEKRPVLGFGQENFELIFSKERKMKVDSAHNIFLETIVASGFVGLGAFLLLIAVSFYKANTTIRLSLIAFLIIAQFNPLSIAHIALFWFLLGML